MICYDKLFELMKKQGKNKTQIRQEKIISQENSIKEPELLILVVIQILYYPMAGKLKNYVLLLSIQNLSNLFVPG